MGRIEWFAGAENVPRKEEIRLDEGVGLYDIDISWLEIITNPYSA